ncbi:SRPBCC family protein [Pseudonocardia lacus]|uniref:SRPBCC family protein n=1 Tax=Pseudonocardia lacus TaxID=2835865 RepID=UPI001BDCA0FA|nr:SRPBCC family protein [Pseudonocardia lacus]
MGDYEHTATVTADPDELFDYLSDVHNLPDYFATMREAELTGASSHGGEEVHVVAEVEGAHREGEAWMTRDAERRTLTWGSEGPNGYRGDLRVEPAGDGSEVTVRLHTERADGPGIRAGLERTLTSIKEKVEGPVVDGS